MSEQFDEYQVEQFEQAAYQGAMLEAGKEWERQREEYDLHEAEWQARAEKAEALIERLVEAGQTLADELPYGANEEIVNKFDALCDEWQAMKGGEE